ncbi:DUF5312 family protein [Gracilinema caldarium]|uniref:DUF5312 family protein n=1 Tax=Gracilinema caldarium TaxID=215591 RepID=UPI0026EBA8B3|nr:DUF5312 family protein [Gracilinema caldarium]
MQPSEGIDTFERLASRLSMEERQALLSKLSSYAVLSKEVLFHEEEVPPKVDVERQYKEIPWYYKLYLTILSFFKGKSPLKLYEDRLISSLGAMIESRAPGLFDHRRNILLSGFMEEIGSLKEAARFFYEALDISLNRDKGAFFSFLASLELDYVHRRLLNETDPEEIAKGNPQLTETDVRNIANRTLDSVFQSINEDERRIMYRNARSLQCLKELSSFLFDRLLSNFARDSSNKGLTAPAYLAMDQLSALNNILYSLQDPPSMALLETLFIFLLQERNTEPKIDLALELKTLLSRAEEALGRIRQFNKRIPLTAIIRCSSRNLSYFPQSITGGEDWFAVYRDYWKKQVEDRCNRYIQEQRRQELVEELRDFFKGNPIKSLQYVAGINNPDGIPIHGAFSLAFLFTFYNVLFVEEINRALKPILIDGEFYKKENRTEFTEAYNELLQLGETIRAFDQKLSPTGDLGKRYDIARQEITALSVKRRKIQVIETEASDEASEIINRAMKALKSLSLVLEGILKGEAGGRYDSLINLGSLAGKSGSYLVLLKGTREKLEKSLSLLNEIEKAGI